MMTETQKTGRWPGALARKDIDLMINLRLRSEFEKRCNREVQSLCSTPTFGMIKQIPGDIDRQPLENIISVAKYTAPLLASLVIRIGPTTFSSMISMQRSETKLVAILAILCRLAHRNNSNYLPLFVALYLYSAGARIDAITLLNHLGIFVSYDILQKKLKAVTSLGMVWIR